MPQILCRVSALIIVLIVAGCASGNTNTREADPADASAYPWLTSDEPWTVLPEPDHTLENFIPGATPDYCFDRDTNPYTSVVDAHFHPRPFGGPPIEFTQMWEVLDRSGVRFVNYFGIGQVLALDSGCTYYLDCPGVPALPSIKNDFANGLDIANLRPENLHVTLSMTFMDLANPEGTVALIELYDREFPGMFSWTGEVNVIKQALLKNHHEPATIEDIDAWAPFMELLAERGIPITLHADLGNNENPTEFLPLLHHIAATYPDNKIVWAHMGLSKELTNMDPRVHVQMIKDSMDTLPNVMIDLSWDVIFNEYHQWGDVYIPFINEYSDRVLPGTDFVAADYKDPEQYIRELEVTSRVLATLDDEAFRKIALGQNYFDYLGLEYEAPPLCE